MPVQSCSQPWAIRLFRKWLWLVGLLPLAAELVVAYIPTGSTPAAVLDFLSSGAKWDATITLFAVGLVASAYLIHREDTAQLAKLQSRQADLDLVLTAVIFLHSEPVLTLQGRFPNGLRPNGLPVRAIVTATIEAHNRGEEEGQLDWRLDLDQSECPDVFSLVKGNAEGEMHNLPSRLQARSRSVITWRLQLAVPDCDPKEFASRLSSQTTCSFLIRYRTLRVGQPSPERCLRLDPDLSQYVATLAERWRTAGQTELASTVK